jgi:hypothetical protein
LAEPKKFPALDERVCWFLLAILIEVGVLRTPPIEEFFH